MHRVPVTGGEAEELASTAEDKRYDQWPSVSGSDVLFLRQVGGSHEIWKVSLNPPWHPVRFLGGPINVTDSRIHPNGLYVAYVSNEVDKLAKQVMLRSYKTPDLYHMRVSPGVAPDWSPDGGTLYYRKARAVWRVRVIPGSGDQSPQLGTPEQVLDLSKLGDAEFAIGVVGPSPDGQRFLAVKKPRSSREGNQLVYVPTWAEWVAREMREGR